MKTGINGLLFAMVGFLVPFVFIYNPAILLEGTLTEIVIGAVQLLIGTYFLAITVSGFWRTNVPTWQRIVTFAVSIGFISPETISTLIAFAIGLVILLLNYVSYKKGQAKITA